MDQTSFAATGPAAPEAGAPEPTPADPVDALLALTAERGWHGFALRDVAAASGLSLAELYRCHPDRARILVAFLARIDAQVLAGAGPVDPEETVRDRLFDALMRRYDALRPYRPALRRLAADLRRDPLAAAALLRAMDRAMGAVLESAGLGSDGVRGAVRKAGLAAIHAAALETFLADETLDLSKTMAVVDRRLKRAERLVQRFDFSKRKPKESGETHDPAGADAAPA